MPEVIRKEQLPAVSSFLLQDVARDAESILAAARAQAAAILESARREAITIAQTQARRAYQAGFEEGRTAGRAAILAEAREKTLAEQRARLGSAIDGLQSLFLALEAQKHSLHAAAEQGVLRLALAIAERVCKLRAGEASDVAIANMRHLLELVRNEPRIQIHLHPDDLPHAQSVAEGFFAGLENSPQLRLVSDESVGRGGARMTTRAGALDAAIDTQIDRIAAALGIVRVEAAPLQLDEAAAMTGRPPEHVGGEGPADAPSLDGPSAFRTDAEDESP